MVLEHNRRSTRTRPLNMQTEFKRKSISGSRSIGIAWEDMILPSVEDPRNCADPKSRTKRVRPKVGKDRVCIIVIWWDKMEMRWCLSSPGSAEYILPVTLSTSVTPVSLYTHRRSLKMYLEAVIERVWRGTWRPRSCELGGGDCASLDIHLEAVIEQVWRCTWRPWSSEIGGVLGGGQSGGGSWGGRRDGSWDSIHWLTRTCGNVENWVQHGLPRDVRLARSGRQSILGWCSTRCMRYSVYAVVGVCCSRCMLYSVYAVLGVCCSQC